MRHNLGLHFGLLGVYFGVDTLVIRFRVQQGAAWCEVLTVQRRVRAGRARHARGRRLMNSLGRRVLPGGEAGQDGVMNALVDHRGAEADYLTALA